MKILPQIHKSELRSLGFRVSMELAAGGFLTALLLRWIAE